MFRQESNHTAANTTENIQAGREEDASKAIKRSRQRIGAK